MSWFFPSKEEKEVKAAFKKQAIRVRLNETRQLLDTRKALLLKQKQDLSKEMEDFQKEALEGTKEWERLVEIESNMGKISDILEHPDSLTETQYANYGESYRQYEEEQKKLTKEALEGSVSYLRSKEFLRKDMRKLDDELRDVEMKLVEIQNPN